MKAILPGVLVSLGIAGTCAYGATIPFDFNTLGAGQSDTSAHTTASQLAVQNYMQGVLDSIFGTNVVTVTATGGIADKTYKGEGFVVGQGAQSLTLGTSDNATNNSTLTPATTYDTFIANTSDASNQISSQISLVFSGLTINSISFDYEIFPDGSCPALNSAQCGGSPSGGIYPNQPDLELTAGTGGSDVAVAAFGTNGTQYGVTPAAASTDGSSTHSPNSGKSGTEVSPQYIGTWSGSVGNVTDLNFVDWPATIGIDNLQITYSQTKFGSPIPEPGSVLLLGTVVGGLFLIKRIRNA